MAEKGRLGCGGAAVIIVVLALGYSMIAGKPTAEIETAQPVQAANDPAACEKLLATRAARTVVRSRVDNRINVDDRAWSAAPADAKRILLQGLACAEFGGRSLEQLDPGQFVVAYGYYSGKRVALAGKSGVDFE